MPYCLTVTAGVGCDGCDETTERYAWRKVIELTRQQRREECLWLEPAPEDLGQPNIPFTCIDFDLDEITDGGTENDGGTSRDEQGNPILTGTYYGSQEGDDTDPDDYNNLRAINDMLTKHGFVQCEGSPIVRRMDSATFTEHKPE